MTHVQSSVFATISRLESSIEVLLCLVWCFTNCLIPIMVLSALFIKCAYSDCMLFDYKIRDKVNQVIILELHTEEGFML